MINKFSKLRNKRFFSVINDSFKALNDLISISDKLRHLNRLKQQQSVQNQVKYRQNIQQEINSYDERFFRQYQSFIFWQEEILLGAQSPLARVQRGNFQFDKYVKPQQVGEIDNNNSSVLEINPVTNKSFRINKMYSSDMAIIAKKKKTPQLIGKLSSSKLSLKNQGYLRNMKINRIKQTKSRSPGHLTQRRHSKRGTKQQILPINSPQVSRFMEFADRDLITSQEPNQPELNPQNQRLSQQFKHKQQYLKQMIEKRKRAGSQQPAPYKNIQQFRYDYPVSKQSTQMNTNLSIKKTNRTSPYLEKIQKNSKLFLGSLMSPRFLNKVKQVTGKYNSNQQSRKTKRLYDSSQQVLQKSQIKQMKITPQINVAFTIKSPRKPIVKQDGTFIAQNQNQIQVQQWRQNLSRVSMYSPQKNSHFNNNRKPKFVSMLIDPSKLEIQQNQDKKQICFNKKNRNLLAQNFSRSRNQSGGQQTENQENLQISYITLKTSISSLKELLIQSNLKTTLRICLPSCLFDNTKINPSIQIRDLHIFIEKVYNELRIHPEIITIKRYKNAIFTGVFQSSTKQFNFFKSIIYHLNGDVYIGDWKESRCPSEMIRSQVDGCKHGTGVQIRYNDQKNKIEEKQIWNNEKNQYLQVEKKRGQKSIEQMQVKTYYGQYQNNKREGYGVSFGMKLMGDEICQERIEMGCWKEDEKNGWVKTYINKQLVDNSEYQMGQIVKQLTLREQKLQSPLQHADCIES